MQALGQQPCLRLMRLAWRPLISLLSHRQLPVTECRPQTACSLQCTKAENGLPKMRAKIQPGNEQGCWKMPLLLQGWADQGRCNVFLTVIEQLCTELPSMCEPAQKAIHIGGVSSNLAQTQAYNTIYACAYEPNRQSLCILVTTHRICIVLQYR